MSGRFKTARPVVDGKKECTKCGKLKPVAEFPVRKDRRSQPRSHCRPCHNAAALLPESKAKQREARYQRKYGISVADFMRMLAEQRYQCRICRTRLNEQNWHVDHDHGTGAVRGVLCDLCNKGLGQFKDNADLLRAAARYLDDRRG